MTEIDSRLIAFDLILSAYQDRRPFDDAQARHLADLADRTLVRQPLRTRDDAGALPLGAAIELPDALWAEPGDPVLFSQGGIGAAM